MADSRNPRSIRLQFGSNRVTIERNGTSTNDQHPFCVKCRSRNFLVKLVEEAALDPLHVFKGSFNHLIFVNLEEAELIMGSMLDMLPLLASKNENDDDDGATVIPLGGPLAQDDDDDLDEEGDDDAAAL